jgi:cytochrome c peroxidase
MLFVRKLDSTPLVTVIVLALAAGFFLYRQVASEEAAAAAAGQWPQIKGYADMAIPADNPMTPAKVELGKQLYYDTRLSGDGSRACYSCHLKEHGLTDGKPKAVGAYNAALPRSSPTLWNIGYHSEFYWDGRSKSLEAQAMAAWTGGNMGVSGKDGRPSTADICARLDAIGAYRKQFQAVFGGGCAPENVVKAISAFERTIVTTEKNSAWIRFRAGDETALGPAARRGYELFRAKAGCTNCHDGLLLTDQQFHNIGIAWDAAKNDFTDLGRFKVTNQERDKGAFKTPTLLDIAKSAPYFHDGSVATLEEAVDFMLGGGRPNPQLDSANLVPRLLTPAERSDLFEFLRALSVNYTIKEPKLPR